MNLLKNKKILHNLLIQGDVLNTINGGSSPLYSNLHEEVDRYVMEVKAPGIKEDALNLVLEGNKLVIFSTATIESGGHELDVPVQVRNYPLPADVNMDEIEAVYSNGVLNVNMPRGGSEVQTKRRIDIRYE